MEVWTTTDFGDTTNSHGAWEMINVDATHGVILTGLKEKPDTSDYAFKSGGNCAGGKAVVITMTIASLSANTAPTITDVATTKTYASYHSAKTAHFVSASQMATLLWADGGTTKSATFAVFNPTTGADLFTPVEHSLTIGEGTDMKIVGTTHAVISGHFKDSEFNSGYSGRLTKVSLNDGSLVWSKEYSSCGFGSTTAPIDTAPLDGQCSKDLIYNECWGVALMADGGFALSCGTGIEGCHQGNLYADCTAGTGDKRPGAYPHLSGIWSSMTVKTDSAGNLEWQRVDSYRDPRAPALPTAPNLPMLADEEGTMESAFTSSAGEWVIPINGGTGLAIMTDQQAGIGIQKFVASTGGSTGGSAACSDNDAQVSTQSDGNFATCAAGAAAGYCTADPPGAPANWLSTLCTCACGSSTGGSTTPTAPDVGTADPNCNDMTAAELVAFFQGDLTIFLTLTLSFTNTNPNSGPSKAIMGCLTSPPPAAVS